jgi:hypothetical protein
MAAKLARPPCYPEAPDAEPICAAQCTARYFKPEDLAIRCKRSRSPARKGRASPGGTQSG